MADAASGTVWIDVAAAILAVPPAFACLALLRYQIGAGSLVAVLIGALVVGVAAQPLRFLVTGFADDWARADVAVLTACASLLAVILAASVRRRGRTLARTFAAASLAGALGSTLVLRFAILDTLAAADQAADAAMAAALGLTTPPPALAGAVHSGETRLAQLVVLAHVVWGLGLPGLAVLHTTSWFRRSFRPSRPSPRPGW